jgi:hypothetical protein
MARPRPDRPAHCRHRVPDVPGRNGARCAFTPIGPHARTAATVRDAEGLVQVQVRDVGAELARLCEPDQRVHVRAVDVDLPAVAMHQPQISRMPFLEHAVGRRVGDHQRRKFVAVPLGLQAQIGEIDVAVGVAVDDHHAMPTICADAGLVPCAERRDQADVRWPSPRAAMIGADREQAGVFALRAGVRLQRNRVVAGDLDQPALQQSFEQLAIAMRLLGRRERVQVRRTPAR